MAAFVRHVCIKTVQGISPKHSGLRFYASKKREIVHAGQRFDSAAESLAAKGFLRSQKPYDPPSDVGNKVKELCKSTSVNADRNTVLQGPAKFDLLAACFQSFQHSVPNSLLHTIETVEDVVVFYETPVNTTVPLDAMKNMELPENLHIQYEPHRFHPDTDTKFGGISAFPKSSTLVTGLKYKNKYKGYTAKTSWP